MVPIGRSTNISAVRIFLRPPNETVASPSELSTAAWACHRPVLPRDLPLASCGQELWPVLNPSFSIEQRTWHKAGSRKTLVLSGGSRLSPTSHAARPLPRPPPGAFSVRAAPSSGPSPAHETQTASRRVVPPPAPAALARDRARSSQASLLPAGTVPLSPLTPVTKDAGKGVPSPE